jgi:hypothetical protein
MPAKEAWGPEFKPQYCQKNLYMTVWGNSGREYAIW